MNRQWVGGDAPYHYLYANEVGRIIGETALLGHARKGMHSCTVYPMASESLSLGVYISSEAAKGMIEYYWQQRDSTVDNNILEQ